ncbi:MAG: ABC transporter permease [Bacteroidetes bacterium]|nr:ABC transporter permease [Bacteroidota bacterium]
MLRNYFKTALRSMRRHMSYSVINILGLAVGFVASFFILLWVQDELKYDQHYEGVEDVYRIMRTSTYGPDQIFTWPAITAKLDDVLDEEYPEIEMVALLSWGQNMSFLRGDVTFREQGYHAGKDFFKILKHDFLAGDEATALDLPNAVVLSNTMARKYFPELYEGAGGSEDDEVGAAKVVGNRLTLDNRLDVLVTAVVKDVPPQSTMTFQYVIAMEEFVQRNDWINDWGNNGLRMIMKLTPGASAAEVSEKIELIIQKNTDTKTDVLFLQPYVDQHLRSNFVNGVLKGGRIQILQIFSLVGFFVLLIAAINFMNLATARSAQRSLEVGIRKTFGSNRGHLALQFLGESLFTALFALVISLIAVALLLPGFNALTDKSISLGLIDGVIWLQFLGIATATGLIAGVYPAVYLSAFTVIGVLRRGVKGSKQGGTLRKGLVVVQFVLSIILIVGSVTVYNQISFIRNKNLGLDRKDVFTSILEGPMLEQYESFSTTLKADPSIQSVTAATQSPLEVGSSTNGGVRWEGRPEDDNTLFNILGVSHDFVETMKIELLAGRDFSPEFGTDSLNIVINEETARAMGFENPVGQPVTVWGRSGHIIGVVKNFHITSLYAPIEPLVLRFDPAETGLVLVRPMPGQTEEALAAFEKVFKQFNPLYPFEYQFIDDTFEQTYRSEVVIGTLSRWFTVLAIFIACLGLYGLASFTAERRTKEIGIRKVMGATVLGVVGLLSKEFILLVVVAFAVAAPISWNLMQKWLGNFEFHTELGWGIFAAAGAGILIITYVTVGYQSVKAALANPAKSLRSE